MEAIADCVPRSNINMSSETHLRLFGPILACMEQPVIAPLPRAIQTSDTIYSQVPQQTRGELKEGGGRASNAKRRGFMVLHGVDYNFESRKQFFDSWIVLSKFLRRGLCSPFKFGH